jgi:hypothetical protein
VIPPPDTTISLVEQQRWTLTRLAAALVRDGVPTTLVMKDAQEGCDLAMGEVLARLPRGPQRGGR